MHKDNWDDLRFVLAVAETGSVSGAARRLGVNHATVLRRIAAFEERAGVTLFDKTPRGYFVPADRAGVVEAAREVEGAVQAVARLLHGAGSEALRGPCRIASTDTLSQALLPEVLAELARRSPHLDVELLCSNTHVDLARMQADVVVRPAELLPELLTGERAGRLGFAVYMRRGADPERWLGLSGPLERSVAGRWIAGHLSPDQIVGSSDSFVVLREMAAAGLGRAVLPCLIGEPDARLERNDAEMPPISVPIWVASHADLSDVPRVRAMRSALAAAIGARAGALEHPLSR